MTALSTPTGADHTPDSADNIPSKGAAGVLVAAGIGAAVAVALGTYAKLHTPTFQGITAFGFPAVLPMKAWFATVAAILGLAQVGSALWMYGRVPIRRPAPTWLGQAHRWFGTSAFLFTLPVAYHCLWALGFQSTDTRVLVHSIAGCAFYGAFTTKMIALRTPSMPRGMLPAAGAVLFTLLVLLWLTSSLWFFQNMGFPGV